MVLSGMGWLLYDFVDFWMYIKWNFIAMENINRWQKNLWNKSTYNTIVTVIDGLSVILYSSIRQFKPI